MLVPTYRSGSSALHASRVGVAAAFALAPCTIALLYENPIVLGGALAAEIAAGLAAGVGRELWRTLRWTLPFALLIALVNPIASSNGVTLLAEGPVLPVMGRMDITLEALVFGLVAGLRLIVTVLPFALFSACVDPDELLRSFRRVSLRSALTVSLATRMVPSLARDGRRLGEAYGLRADASVAATRRARAHRSATLIRALAAGALERSIDAAAALEVRGYGNARRVRRAVVPWSRHDFAFAAAALSIVLAAIAGRLSGAGAFDAYPLLNMSAGAQELLLSAAFVSLSLMPFALAAVARTTRYARAEVAGV
jgi:energy-coupling factor transport system permease protein